MNDEEFIASVEATAIGYFVVVVQQFDIHQGFVIDEYFKPYGEKLVIGVDLCYPNITINQKIEVIAKKLLVDFRNSGVGGVVGERKIIRNEISIGQFGAAIRRCVGADYFWIDGRFDNNTYNVTNAVVHPVQATSFREGRQALLEVPVIAKLRVMGKS